jgi:hypothetical protein
MRFSSGALATEGSCRTAMRSAGGRSDGRRLGRTRDLRMLVSLDFVFFFFLERLTADSMMSSRTTMVNSYRSHSSIRQRAGAGGVQ